MEIYIKHVTSPLNVYYKVNKEIKTSISPSICSGLKEKFLCAETELRIGNAY
jgi:hypothetical protein